MVVGMRISPPEELPAPGRWDIGPGHVVTVSESVGGALRVGPRPARGTLQLTNDGVHSTLHVTVGPADGNEVGHEPVELRLRVADASPSGDWVTVGSIRAGVHCRPVVGIVSYRGVFVRSNGPRCVLGLHVDESLGPLRLTFDVDLDLLPSARVAQRLVPRPGRSTAA